MYVKVQLLGQGQTESKNINLKYGDMIRRLPLCRPPFLSFEIGSIKTVWLINLVGSSGHLHNKSVFNEKRLGLKICLFVCLFLKTLKFNALKN